MSPKTPARLANVLVEQKTSVGGLTVAEAARRLKYFGPNKIEHTASISPLKIMIEQFNSFLVWLLFGAFLLAYLIGEKIDALVIMVVIVVNAIIGFVQEFKAEKALAQLQKLETPVSRVKRNGEVIEVSSRSLVPGDVILLEAGNKVPVDATIIENHLLSVDESILTGESLPVTKDLKKEFQLFAGTTVIRGRCEAVATKTGMKTSLGHIAQLVQTTHRSLTPLQITLKNLGKMLGVISLLMAAPALVLGIWKGMDIYQVILTAISLAVSSIPEGLPIVVTIALAVGVQRMVKKKVLVRKLSAVEALGSTNVILSDKTGTITFNQMKVTQIFSPTGGVQHLVSLLKKKTLQKSQAMMAQAAVLCSDATQTLGSPTEKALIDFGKKLGFETSIRDQYKRLDELPFSSKNKYMLTLNQLGKTQTVFAKGAPEKILRFCDWYQSGPKKIKLTAVIRTQIIEQLESFSKKGMRVLALSCKEIRQKKDFKIEKNHLFLGLVALIDPPRSHVNQAIAKCQQAGIRVVMVTGDHPLTAQSIAQEVGINASRVMTGEDLEKLSHDKFEQTIKETDVFARVSPQHKLKILSHLQDQGYLVAMTGDGVNDAPALKKAHIGVAVGSGSDLAKEVADMIILDDDFSSIVAAIHEGRGIFFNIKKFVKFLIAVNFDEVFLIAISIFLNLPLPLLPIHLLWLNLVTDSLPALALAVDPYDPDVMKKPPYDPNKEIKRGVLQYSVIAGALALVASLTAFGTELLALSVPVNLAQTVVFTVTVLFELIIIFSVRSDKRFRKSKPFSNKWLVVAVAIATALQLTAVYLPQTQVFFRTTPIPLSHWPLVISLSMMGLLGFEIIKFFRQKSPPEAETVSPKAGFVLPTTEPVPPTAEKDV